MVRRPMLWAAIAVVVAVVAVHGRSIGFSFTDLDDRDFVVDDHESLVQPGVVSRALSRSYMHVVDPSHAYYRPLVTLSYALDARWSGVRPGGYHLTNVVLHAAACVLFLALLRCLAFGPGLALAAACAFAVHPVAASAVAWIPGRNELLLAVFGLSSWLCFVLAWPRRAWAGRLLHVVFFWLALGAKETAIVVPLVCLAHVALLGHGAGSGAAALVPPSTWLRPRPPISSLLLALGWTAGIGARWFAHPLSSGATARDVAHNLPLVLTAFGQATLPMGTSLVSVREDLPSWIGLAAAGAIAVAVHAVPGVRKRVVAFGAVAFLLFLSPSLAVPGSLVLGSRFYLPTCGAIVVLSELVRALAPERRAFVAFSGVALGALALLCVACEEPFRDRRSFARGAVAASPHSPLAHFCLGKTFQVDGNADGALAEYRMALELGAVFGVHNNIAVLYMASARWPEAERELREELAVDPDYAPAERNLAIVLRHEGRTDEAR